MRKVIFSIFALVFTMQVVCMPINAADTSEYEKNTAALSALGILEPLYTQLNDEDSIISIGMIARAVNNLSPKTITNTESYDEATTAQAAAMLLKGLGLHVKMNEDSLTLTDYYLAAQREGILKGVSASVNDKLTSGEFAIMVKNALSIKQLEGYTVDGETDYIEKGSYLEQKGISKGRGIVESSSVTSLKKATGSSSKVVSISGNEYFKGDCKTDEMLGFSVEFYVYDETDELICITDSGRNTVTEIDAFDIDSVTESMMVRYYENGKKKKIDADNDFSLIYNGKYRLKKLPEYLKPKLGSVKLIDNDDDGKYEVAIVTSYEVCVVNSSRENEIFCKYGKPNIDVSEPDKTKIIKNGNVIKASRLKRNDILYVAAAITGDYTEIKLSGKKITGTVTAVSQLSDEYVIYTIDGMEYKASTRLDTANVLGRNGTFYLGISEIIEEQIIDNSGRYAILLAAGKENDIGNFSLKLFCSDGKTRIYELDDNAVLHEGRETKIGETEIRRIEKYISDCMAAPIEGAVTGNAAPIVMYSLREGKIKSVSLPVIFDKSAYGSKRDENVLQSVTPKNEMLAKQSRSLFRPDGGFYPNQQTELNDGAYKFLEPETLIFEISVDEKLAFKENFEKNIMVYTGANHRFQNWTYGNYYNVSDAMSPEVIVFYQTPIISGNYTDGFLIEKFEKAIDDSGELIYKMHGYTKNGYRSFTVAEDVTISNSRMLTYLENIPKITVEMLEKGDYIFPCTAGNGIVQYIEPVVMKRFAKNEYVRAHNAKSQDGYGEEFFGEVTDINGGLLTIKFDKNLYDGQNEFYVKNWQGRKKVIYDEENDKVSDEGEIEVGDYVFMRRENTNILEIFIRK